MGSKSQAFIFGFIIVSVACVGIVVANKYSNLNFYLSALMSRQDLGPLYLNPLLRRCVNQRPEVVLSWSASDGALTYTVERRAAGQNWWGGTNIATKLAKLSYADSGLRRTGTYEYRVLGMNGRMKSISNTIKIEVSLCTPLAATSTPVATSTPMPPNGTTPTPAPIPAPTPDPTPGPAPIRQPKPAPQPQPVPQPVPQPAPTPIPQPTPSPTPQPIPPPQPTPQLQPSTVSSKIQWGAYVSWDPAAFAAFEALIGKQMNIYATFISWGNERDFPKQFGPTVRDKGKTLLIYWEPQDYNVETTEQPLMSYDAILRGDWNTYFQEFAANAKAYGGPVILLPFDEMNGDWSPWSGTKNNNTPAKEIAAWRYMHKYFASAPNVKFGWAPNNDSLPDVPGNQLEDYYPGDEYVDYVGVDGFNFGNPWQTWSQVFDHALQKLAKYNKPIYLFSMASAEGPQKAAWISDGLGMQIKKYPLLKGWIWFNENKERDWRVNSDPASLEAFRHITP